MGVINLGVLVEKIRKKLSGTFIKTTDYATASTAGIVKVGSNIDVTSDGTISVTFPASGGMTADAIWTGNLTDSWQDITSSLTHPLSDYKAIFFNVIPSETACSGTGMIFVSTMPAGTNNISTVYYGTASTNHIDVRLGADTVSIKAGAAVQGVHMIGIK